jgi:hypothetical protein
MLMALSAIRWGLTTTPTLVAGNGDVPARPLASPTTPTGGM